MEIVLGGRDEVSWLTGADVLLRWARGTSFSRGPRSIFGGELSIYVSTYPICSRTGSLSSLPFPCLLIPTTSLTIPSWVPTNKQKLPSSISSKAWAIKNNVHGNEWGYSGPVVGIVWIESSTVCRACYSCGQAGPVKGPHRPAFRGSCFHTTKSKPIS